ncbi:SH3-like domain-containing protein [Crenalkalicoccus roseus]|uniref:SH3-like domain-containing protein n=1 Tax=Crenalkalicoccus roseus TaxID=1485588 RepID=UPI0010811D17|nr:SH3-like domain-containing protein [Crenalkalicoccus roseus]
MSDDAAPRFSPGDRVQVRDDWPERRGPCHIRTPHYLRGRTGTVERVLGAFPNPEDLAFARPAPRRVLYHVLFDQPPLWREGEPGDQVLVEIFEHWLEPAAAPAKEAA